MEEWSGQKVAEWKLKVGDLKSAKIRFRVRSEGMFQAAYFGPNVLHYRFKKRAEINDGQTVCEMHVGIHPDCQRQGLAARMIKAFVDQDPDKGSVRRQRRVAWFAFGRILNSDVLKVIDQIKADPDYAVSECEYGVTVKRAEEPVRERSSKAEGGNLARR